ncbi:MAG: c-type cytochrome [Hyphomicrobium sp.]|nr:c-type cytochrome [Hyphomicrobium sp.]
MTGKSVFSILFLGMAIGVAGLAIFSPSWGPAPPPAVRTVDNVLPSAPAAPPTTWPDYSLNGPGFQPPAMADGELIAYGHRLVTQTFALIGPEAADPAKRFAGNNLSCQNCHLDGGTNRTGLPLVGVAKTYPKFSARDNRVLSLPERLDDCMTRSMNGRPLPGDSREMKALLAFLGFITEPAPIQPEPAPAPPQPADTTRGLAVFGTVCAACHQPDGQGVRIGSVNDGRGYRFPPLWGPDSFNDGAGMNTFNDAVGFVRRNMPRGVDPQHPQLTLQQAWDVVAYLKTMPRPKDLSAR